MSRSITLGVVGGVALVVGGMMYWMSFDRTPIHEGTAAIVLTDEGFQPDTIRIAVGTTVTFTTTRSNQFWPASNLHPEHTIYSEFDPKRPIDSSESWSFTFDRPGTWGYHDHIRSYFTGVIYVEE